MREQQHESAEQLPLVLTGSYELINDDLRAVSEVAELRLPQRQRLREVAAVSVLESHDRRLGQRRIEDLEWRLVLRYVLQRDVDFFILHVDERRMALVECSAARILARDSDRCTLLQQSSEGEPLGHPVIDRPFALCHLATLFEQLLQLGMDVELSWRRAYLLIQRRQLLGRYAGLNFVLGFVRSAVEIVPIGRQRMELRLLGRCCTY